MNAIRSQQIRLTTQHHLVDPSEKKRIEAFNLALGMPPWMTSEFIKDLSVEDFINIQTVILKEKTVDEFLKKISESSINVTELKKVAVLFNYLNIDYNEKNKNLFIKFRRRLYPNMNFIDLLKDKERQRKNKSNSISYLEKEKAKLKQKSDIFQQALDSLPKTD